MHNSKICFSISRIKYLILGVIIIITSFFITKYITNNSYSSKAKGKEVKKIKPFGNLSNPILLIQVDPTPTKKSSLLKSITSRQITKDNDKISVDEIQSYIESNFPPDIFDDYTYLILPNALSIPRVTIINPQAIPIIVGEKVVAFALPKVSFLTGLFTAFTLALNPGIVQDVIEGNTVYANGQVVNLTVQEASYLRIDGVLRAIADTDGNTIARVAQEGEADFNNCFQNNQGCQPQGESSQNSYTPQMQADIRKEVEGDAKLNTPLAQLMRKWANEKNGGQPIPQIRIKINNESPEITTSYYDFSRLETPLTARDVVDFVNAARASNIEVVLHVGPGNTIDPILQINPKSVGTNTNGRVIVLAIDSESQPNMDLNPVINLEDNFLSQIGRYPLPRTVNQLISNYQQVRPTNVGIYIRLDIKELLNQNLNFPYIRIVAPYPSGQYEQDTTFLTPFISDISTMLQPGARFDVILHQNFNLGGQRGLYQALYNKLEVLNGYTSVGYNTYNYSNYKQAWENIDFVTIYGPSTSAFLNYLSPINVISITR